MTLSRLLSYSSFLTSIAIIIALFFPVQEIYDKPEYPERVHITIYLERNFDDFEQEKILAAAMQWTQATNYRVQYDIVQLPTREKIHYKDAIFFVKISPDHPTIILMDNIKHTRTLAYYDDKYGAPSISLVTDRMLDDQYQQIVMHELGHSLGIEHLEGIENIDTLMYPYTNVIIDGVSIPAGSDTITKKDVAAFCKLYHCNPDKL